MTISKDLFLAILSMDSYNQGYGRGINHGKTQIGSATINTDSEEVFRDPSSDPETPTSAQAAGFYAIAYDVKASGVAGIDSDTTVISYRGTARHQPSHPT